MKLITRTDHHIWFFAGLVVGTEEVSNGYHRLEEYSRVPVNNTHGAKRLGLTGSNTRTKAIELQLADCASDKPLHGTFAHPSLTTVV